MDVMMDHTDNDEAGEGPKTQYICGVGLMAELDKPETSTDPNFSLVQPIQNGRVVDWDALEALL
jgi:actin-related protein